MRWRTRDAVSGFSCQIGSSTFVTSPVSMTCTGTEANEVAMSMARIGTGGRGFICTDAAYHGNSAEVGKLTRVRDGKNPEIRSIPFPQRYRPLKEGASESELAELYLGEVRAAIDGFKEDKIPLAGMLVCPILANEGLPDIPDGFMRRAAEMVRDAGGLFIADEVQSGLGRTGKVFACDHENVKPDMLILGKALGGGMMPVSAVLASNEIMGVFKPGDHGSTFGGNPLGCAVARVAMRILIRDKLSERAAEIGEPLMDRLRELNSPLVKEVRGRGLFIGIELHESAGGAKKLCKQLKDEGMLCKETVENVIRLAPPLIIEQKDLDWAFERIARVLCA